MTLAELKTELGGKPGVIEVVSDPPRVVKFAYPVINVQYLFQESTKKIKTESFTVFQNPNTLEIFYYKKVPDIMQDAPPTRDPIVAGDTIKEKIQTDTTFSVVEMNIIPRDKYDIARVILEDATGVFPQEYRVWQDEVTVWEQPIDKATSYAKEAIVSHNGSFWFSLLKENQIEPGTDPLAWTEKAESDLTHIKQVKTSA